MSLKEFIENEIDIANFKLRSLGRSDRLYKKRLAEVEVEFLQIDFNNIATSEKEARDAVKLFRLSRPEFYLKYGEENSIIKNFSKLQESILARKRYILKKSEDLESGIPSKYVSEITDIYSYSDLIAKRQISRANCGAISLSKYIKESMLDIYKNVKELDHANIMYAKSLVDNLVYTLEDNWYSKYNNILLSKSFGKIKPLRKLINKNITEKDKVDASYSINTDIKSVGNEHSKIVHLDILNDNKVNVNRWFSKKLRSCAASGNKILVLNYLDETNIDIKVSEVILLTGSTRSESIAINALKPIVKSVCNAIYEEYHSF